MLRCGLLGEKLGHSYSPGIHAMLGNYEYHLYEKTPEELPDFIRNGTWDGLNVTIPYKKKAAQLCDSLSETALQVGSVNTLVRRPDGTIYGDNTDVYGFSYLLKQMHTELAGKKALILGNGGACVAVRYVLEQQNAHVVVISRNGEDHYHNLDRHRDAALIVNTTPVGMYPGNGKQPLDLRAFPSLEFVLDIIYNPARTALILQAEELGIPGKTGLAMLTAQAVKSSALFTGQEVPSGKIAAITEKLSAEMQNIVLIGMPGCGKSTVASILAEKSGRRVVDTDQEFTRVYQMTPEECILTAGEKEFRKKETKILEQVCKESGLIISTGGGCVTVPENYPILHQNSRIIWISRNIRELPVEGRPLSIKEGNDALYAVRKPLYERFSDCRIPEAASALEAADQIQKLGYL